MSNYRVTLAKFYIQEVEAETESQAIRKAMQDAESHCDSGFWDEADCEEIEG